MAINVTLGQVSNLNNQSILAQTNANSAIIQTALVDAVSRSGGSPNQMNSTLDMNSNPIINVPFASQANEPVVLAQITNTTTLPVGFPTLVEDVTGTVNTSTGQVPTTLATVNSNVGTFGGATAVPIITVNAKGLTTAVTTAALNSAVVNGVSFPANPSTNTVPVVTSANTITYEAVPNSAMNTMTANTVKANPTGSTTTPTDTVAPVLGNNGGTGGSVTLNGSTSGSCIVAVAAAAGTSTRFQLPPTNGVNTNVLQTDGSGNTSWVTAGSGTTLVSNVVYSGTQTITIPTSPANATKAWIRMWGGTGGSGGVANVATNCTGGTGSAGHLEKYLTGLTAGNTLAYTQGGAGAAGTSGGGNGGNGTASTLASGTQTITTLTANGSNGSLGANPGQTAGTAGGTATNGDLNISGVSGQNSFLGVDAGFTVPQGVGGVPGMSTFSFGSYGVSGVGGAKAGNAGNSGGLTIMWFT